MKTAIKRVLATALMVPALAFGVISLVPAGFASAAPGDKIQEGINATTDDPGGSANLNDVFKTVVNVLLYVIGAISVVMLIYGGIRYTISGGDSSRVTAAKNTIMYALIGLVIAFLAYAIINWVLSSLSGN